MQIFLSPCLSGGRLLVTTPGGQKSKVIPEVCWSGVKGRLHGDALGGGLPTPVVIEVSRCDVVFVGSSRSAWTSSLQGHQSSVGVQTTRSNF